MAPEGRCYHTSTLIGRNLYVFGGMGKSKIFPDLFVFNVDTDTWTKVQFSLEKRKEEERVTVTKFNVWFKSHFLSVGIY